MAQPVYFETLHALTGGDVELEKELFSIFLSSARECLDGLASSMEQEQSSAWKRHAHALKGICLNLGAEHFGELCRQAQEDFRALPEDKATTLQNLESELALVTTALQEKLGQTG